MDSWHILVVDDDPALREMLGDALRHAGYVVLLASDGQEAMRQCRAQRVDLVVMDLFMPTQEGLETIRQLRHEFGTLPIIVMSGGDSPLAAPSRFRIAELLGARRVFAKPFPLPDLLAAIGDLLPRLNHRPRETDPGSAP